MTLENLANLAEIIGFMVVVVTLVYLAIQTKQNNDFLAAQARYNLVERRAHVSGGGLTQFGQESLHKYAAGDEVTPAERGVALFTALRTIELWEWQFGEYQAGMLSLNQLPLPAWRLMFRGEGVVVAPIREVWESREDALNRDFVKFVRENVIVDGKAE